MGDSIQMVGVEGTSNTLYANQEIVFCCGVVVFCCFLFFFHCCFLNVFNNLKHVFGNISESSPYETILVCCQDILLHAEWSDIRIHGRQFSFVARLGSLTAYMHVCMCNS